MSQDFYDQLFIPTVLLIIRKKKGRILDFDELIVWSGSWNVGCKDNGTKYLLAHVTFNCIYSSSEGRSLPRVMWGLTYHGVLSQLASPEILSILLLPFESLAGQFNPSSYQSNTVYRTFEYHAVNHGLVNQYSSLGTNKGCRAVSELAASPRRVRTCKGLKTCRWSACKLSRAGTRTYM